STSRSRDYALRSCRASSSGDAFWPRHRRGNLVVEVVRFLAALTGKASDAVQTITCGLTAMRSTGTTMWMPLWLSYLTRANAEIDQFDDARRGIGEAMADGNGQGEMVRGRGQSHCRENRTTLARSGCGESGRVFRARARGCEGAAGEVLGIARRDEHGAAVARSRQAGVRPR